MELQELTTRTLALFGVDDVDDLGQALMRCVMNDDADKMRKFVEIIKGDLTIDWLQMIYQYYCADRQDAKQDFTPSCIAQFLSRLIGKSEETVDMCAGSGALTIQRWAENKDTKFTLLEIDENVIPYLIFNLVIRNIEATVVQTDILQQETIETWKVRKGERFGKVLCLKSTV